MHKRRWALAITLSLTSTTASQAQAAASEGAESAYRAAQKSYYALKKDASRRRRRDQWQMVAKKFEAVANKYPESERAPDSLFTAAQLFEDLSRISFVSEDLEASARDYRRLLDQHPRHHLVDDGALALAKLLLERQNDPDGARRTLTRALHDFPKGDRSRELKSLLASLPADAKKSTVATRKTGGKPDSVAVAARAPDPRKSASGADAEDEGDVTDAASKPKAHGAAVEPEVEVELPVSHPLVAEAAPPEPISHEPAAALKDKEKDRELAQAPVSKSMKERLKALSKKTKVELSLAEQLGLKVRRVVIDAGHGGHDAGAVGPGGTREKDVSLAIAKRLAQVLESNGLEVVLTRDEDTFVRLEDRAKIANEARGDLFISVHCNSAQSHTLHGVETYTLNLASDRYSIRLAARENSTTAKRMSDLQFILADLATKANTDESTQLASRVQHSVVNRLGAKYANVRDLGNKEALFYVLLGAKMPSILVETSFISNPEEEKRLQSKMYQDDVARSIAAGVEEFLGARERVAKVD